VAWLSLDAGDNDPARFWRHVVAALDRAAPGPATGRPAARAARGAANRTEAVARARELNLIP
jgi:LuxR family maltose regulon positive regulatory protein